jgi:hypothetical protein
MRVYCLSLTVATGQRSSPLTDCMHSLKMLCYFQRWYVHCTSFVPVARSQRSSNEICEYVV